VAYLAVFLVALTVTFLFTPVVRRLALERGAIVAPDERDIHERPTPTLGGAAMLAGVLVAMVLASQMGAFEDIFAVRTETVGVVIAALLIFGVGLIDDLRSISAPAKVAGMVLAGSVLSFAGVSLLFMRVPLLDVFVLSADLSAVLTVLWVVGMANAINLIDGLDGLAAGIVAIGAGSFFFYALELGDNGIITGGNPGPLIAVITAGVCLGFLPHNFHPAQIFMGDGGSLLLGLLLAASTISVGGRTAQGFTGQTYFFFAPIFIPLFILGVPILDTVFAIVRRARSGRDISAPDKGHIHHRIMDLGHGQRRSVIILWLWTALLSAFVLFPTYTGESPVIALAGIVVLAVVLVAYTLLRRPANRLALHPSDRSFRDRSGR